jgi:predicted aconitase with swiveling domain
MRRIAEGRVLIPGEAEGPLLRLTAPLSFWGGIDPASGDIILASHPQRGRNVAGTVLALPEPIGSSSSSYVLLELIHAGKAPTAIILGQADGILAVGALVAIEMGWKPPPMLELGAGEIARIADDPIRIANGALLAK